MKLKSLSIQNGGFKFLKIKLDKEKTRFEFVYHSNNNSNSVKLSNNSRLSDNTYNSNCSKLLDNIIGIDMFGYYKNIGNNYYFLVVDGYEYNGNSLETIDDGDLLFELVFLTDSQNQSINSDFSDKYHVFDAIINLNYIDDSFDDDFIRIIKNISDKKLTQNII